MKSGTSAVHAAVSLDSHPQGMQDPGEKGECRKEEEEGSHEEQPPSRFLVLVLVQLLIQFLHLVAINPFGSVNDFLRMSKNCTGTHRPSCWVLLSQAFWDCEGLWQRC